MKKIIFSVLGLTLFVACGGGGESKEEKKEAEPAKTEVTDITQLPDYQKGLAIAAKSDCFTCHKIEEKNIGPAWRDVANKYAGVDTAVEYLSKKIIDGGSGVWGQVPMAPHPTFSEEDAKTLARYVLLMKK